ncbi:hypothetical protein ACIP5Y_24225 [Nocardia sp. NPDC088792]|uniref:hypothetical protein n=1 Tax=Nocardia sp. NPDC088792 TaxID=3364332 RepID=UPI0038230A82
MHDEQTPQQALDIAAAATRRAHEAARVPGWAPASAGVLTALVLVLIDVAIGSDLGLVIRAIAAIAGIAAGIALFKVMSWIRATRRTRGVLPRPASRRQNGAIWWLQQLVPFQWAEILIDVIVGAWIWYTESRFHTPWKRRPRTAPKKN